MRAAVGGHETQREERKKERKKGKKKGGKKKGEKKEKKKRNVLLLTIRHDGVLCCIYLYLLVWMYACIVHVSILYKIIL